MQKSQAEILETLSIDELRKIAIQATQVAENKKFGGHTPKVLELLAKNLIGVGLLPKNEHGDGSGPAIK